MVAADLFFVDRYKEIRRGFLDLGQFDDIIRLGRQPSPSKVAMLFAESSDVWVVQSVYRAFNNSHQGYRYGTFGSARQAMFLLLLHTGIPFDIVIEEDALGSSPPLAQYQFLFVLDPHVRNDAAAGIERWVRRGGTLFASAGAGIRNEFNRTSAFAKMLGAHTSRLDIGSRGLNATIDFIKQDLAWAERLDTVKLGSATLGVFGHAAALHNLHPDTSVLARFEEAGTAAVTQRPLGQGKVINCAMHPGLAYVHPAIPRRPVDRGTDDSAFNHFIPHEFNVAARDQLVVGTTNLSATPKLVSASHALCDAQLITAPRRNASVVVLVNWAGKTLRNLTVALERGAVPSWSSATLASGGRVVVGTASSTSDVFTVERLEAADALIFRQ